MKIDKIFFLIAILANSLMVTSQNSLRWSEEKANQWYNDQPWINGANFLPSTAINQLEMWQKDTFDPETIDKELGWAEGIGFNTMRVYLHSLAYEADKEGFKDRIDNYLSIADNHKIKTIFVFFDDVWDKTPKVGKQREPVPGTHNSGWVQDPGDPAHKIVANFPKLEVYVKDIVRTFATDDRILMWDLYNEPGNSDKLTTSMDLLQNIFAWVRQIGPDQPITAGIWSWGFEELNQFQILNSDIITYHDYEEPDLHLRVLQLLKTHNRPLVCTEYMARTRNSRFSNIMPMLKEANVGAINWGLVSGKSNTIYAWNTPIEDGSQPTEWFHDVFYKDGTPYRKDEVNLIKKLNNKK